MKPAAPNSLLARTSHGLIHLAGSELSSVARFVAWAEGSKEDNALAFANSDHRACRLFIDWTRHVHHADAVFVMKLNLHADNDERAARAFWLDHLDLEQSTRFYTTSIKPGGSGHRKNHLHHGVAQARARRSTGAFHRTIGWIDELAARL